MLQVLNRIVAKSVRPTYQFLASTSSKTIGISCSGSPVASAVAPATLALMAAFFPVGSDCRTSRTMAMRHMALLPPGLSRVSRH
jgi:hypothetical protein